MTHENAPLSDEELLALRLAPREGIIVEAIADELIIFSEQDNATYSLNGPAAVIWRLLDGERTGSDILSRLEEAYESGPTAGEVATTLRGLRSTGLIGER